MKSSEQNYVTYETITNQQDEFRADNYVFNNK